MYTCKPFVQTDEGSGQRTQSIVSHLKLACRVDDSTYSPLVNQLESLFAGCTINSSHKRLLAHRLLTLRLSLREDQLLQLRQEVSSLKAEKERAREQVSNSTQLLPRSQHAEALYISPAKTANGSAGRRETEDAR